jgi:hypothetical protein
MAAAIALFLLYQWDVNQVEHRLLTEAQQGQVLFQNPANAVRLSISNEDRTVVLSRPDGPGGDWRVVEPEALDANDNVVNTLLENLRGARRHATLEADDLAAYGLDSPALSVQVTVKENGQEVVRTLEFGDQPEEFGKIYARIAEEDSVFTVSDWLFRQLGVSLDDVRDRTVLSADLLKATKLTVENRHNEFALERESPDARFTLTRGVPVPIPADRVLMDRVMANLTQGTFMTIHDSPTSTTAQLGLDDPFATLAADGETLLEIGMRIPGTDRFIARAGNAMGEVMASMVTDLFRSSYEWGTKSFIWMDPAGFQQIETSSGNTNMMLLRQNGEWTFATMPGVPMRDDAIEAFIQDLGRIAANSFVKANLTREQWVDYGITDETYHVTVTGENGTVQGIRFGRTDSREGFTYALRTQDNSLWKMDFRLQSGVFKFANDLQENRMIPDLADRTARFEVEVKGNVITFEKTPAAWRATFPDEQPVLVPLGGVQTFLYGFEALEVESEMLSPAKLPAEATFRFYEDGATDPFATLRLLSRNPGTRNALFEYSGKQIEVSAEQFDLLDTAMTNLLVTAKIEAEKD